MIVVMLLASAMTKPIHQLAAPHHHSVSHTPTAIQKLKNKT
jgi:hypothetical protein